MIASSLWPTIFMFFFFLVSVLLCLFLFVYILIDQRKIKNKTKQKLNHTHFYKGMHANQSLIWPRIAFEKKNSKQTYLTPIDFEWLFCDQRTTQTFFHFAVFNNMYFAFFVYEMWCVLNISTYQMRNIHNNNWRKKKKKGTHTRATNAIQIGCRKKRQTKSQCFKIINFFFSSVESVHSVQVKVISHCIK